MARQRSSGLPLPGGYDGGYVSDDEDMRLRNLAPAPCRLCRRFSGKHSIVDRSPLLTCDRPADAPNSDILAVLLMQQAASSGACPFREGFDGSAAPGW